MRIFLFALVFNLVFRPLTVVFPCQEWRDELEVDHYPRRLPTQAELAEMADGSEVSQELWRTADSLWEYARPWPGSESRARLRSGTDWGAWALTWTASRFEFAENLVGFNQEWAMFSPTVASERRLTRARLTYADGTEREVRLRVDPVDLAHYSHWFMEKIQDHELHVRDRDSRIPDCAGHCNLLAHRYPTSASGASVETIHLFEVVYRFCPPDEPDPAAYLRAQTGPPPGQIFPDYFVYDVATRQGRRIERP
jgi:hypothetical protein